MNIPFPLLSAALLFWGWRVDHPLSAVVMALLLEGSRFISWRWHPADRELYRVSDLGALILVGLVLYSQITGERTLNSVLNEMQIFPLAFFPLMLAQAYTGRGDYPLSGLFYAMRAQSPNERLAIRLDYPFFSICLLSATVSAEPSLWYYPASALLIAIALWLQRPRRYSPSLWVLLMLLVALLTEQTQNGILFINQTLGEILSEWAAQSFQGEPDPYQQNTVIGSIGRIKLRERILFRVDQPAPWTVPLYLREGSYDRLLGNTWHSSSATLRTLQISEPVGHWQLLDNAPEKATLTIHQHFTKTAALIPSPQGAVRIEGLPALTLGVNPYGVIKASDLADFASYRIFYNKENSFDAPPSATDKIIPVRERPALAKIVAQLQLAGLPEHQVLELLYRFFNDNFRYSLILTNKGNTDTPISRFLLENRVGHCEYFATASVLLLREVGIPARYVVGYSVQEKEGTRRIVRARHAHAWASAYLDGVWQDVDNTPSTWATIDEENAPYWSALTDLWSRMWFAIDQYKHSNEPQATWPWILLAAVLSGIMIWRIFRGTSIQKKSTAIDLAQQSNSQSPFSEIEAHLTRQGWDRGIGEPLGVWLRRIGHSELFSLLALHYRDRYDPLGLSPDEKQCLVDGVAAWLNSKGVAAHKRPGAAG